MKQTRKKINKKQYKFNKNPLILILFQKVLKLIMKKSKKLIGMNQIKKIKRKFKHKQKTILLKKPLHFKQNNSKNNKKQIKLNLHKLRL